MPSVIIRRRKTDFCDSIRKKNTHQHAATLQQFQGKDVAYQDALRWFKTLPLFYESDTFRVVHACWDPASIEFLQGKTEQGILPEHLYAESARKNSALFKAVEITCKGKETNLPEGITFSDKDGIQRKVIRTKWWLNPEGRSIREMSVVKGLNLPNHPFETVDPGYYQPEEEPVFFGHYWMEGTPELMQPNVCCVDYSVAKAGVLCGYRFSGEKQLNNAHFVYV